MSYFGDLGQFKAIVVQIDPLLLSSNGTANETSQRVYCDPSRSGPHYWWVVHTTRRHEAFRAGGGMLY